MGFAVQAARPEGKPFRSSREAVCRRLDVIITCHDLPMAVPSDGARTRSRFRPSQCQQHTPSRKTARASSKPADDDGFEREPNDRVLHL
jgi:hypothetical protein